MAVTVDSVRAWETGGMSEPFTDRSRRGQLHVLRQVATEALAQFGLEPAAMRLVNYEFNATYRVDVADGSRYAMRINVNSDSGPSDIAAETAWVEALAGESSVVVARPLAARSGNHVVEVEVDSLARRVPVVAYSWLEGRILGDAPSIRQLSALGATMARLHEHAARWKPPAGIEFRDVNDVMLGCETNFTALDDPSFPAGTRALVERANADVREVTAPAFASRPAQPIHTDLHPWNAMWDGADLGVFDFDDAGTGSPAHDLAIAVYYQRDAPEREAALYDGYRSVAELPAVDPDVFEAMVAARNLLLINDVLASITAGIDDFIPGYIAKSVGRLERFLATGRFSL